MFIPIDQYKHLVVFANKISWYYYADVYLIGSSLVSNNYRDVDVVVCLADNFFELRYGTVQAFINEGKGLEKPFVRKKWALDCCKNWQRCCQHTGLNIDFKILPHSIFFGKQYENCKRVLISE